ncbi:MAG TPA: flagellar basal body-associated FliL family protein [Polyangiaceae bacterium]|nr:flagellar basal body-associated FliL family protein [Polyangiaceae bacterium]
MDETEPTEVAARESPKKSKVGTIIAAVLVVSIAAVGGIFGTKMMGHGGKAQKHAAAEKESETEGEGESEGASSEGEGEGEGEGEEHAEKGSDAAPAETVPMPQVVVDVRDKDGDVHHLKVGLQFETKKLPEEEFAKVLPRGREALVTYLRGLTFESATDPKAFEKIRKEIQDRTKKAVGKSRVKRVLITEYVAQ